MDREYYENLEMPERDRSEYPCGFKHYTKNEIFETNALEISLIWYKIKRLIFGVNDERKHKTTKYDYDYVPIIRKVIYIDEEYKP